MDLVEFRLSLAADGPPQEASALLQALWHDARSNWNHTHALVQSQRGPQAAAIHAYLHRKEGDVANADYWVCARGRGTYRDGLAGRVASSGRIAPWRRRAFFTV